jgi:hypothetical protein
MILDIRAAALSNIATLQYGELRNISDEPTKAI